MTTITIDFLRRIPIFTGIPDEKLEKVRRTLVQRHAEKGTVIVKEGELGSEMFILLQGEVVISRSLLLKIQGHGMDQRDKSLTRLTGKDHAFFGEMALAEEHLERTASVSAQTDCELAVVSREAFFKLVETDKEIGYFVWKGIARSLSTRLEKTTEDVLKLATALSLALER
ncbi:MAG: cyclic nucleotide-binding domain-containing protein [Ignavibacteriales bacterium]|nr:cyclic nucleotide-binding domain-containing protein [Ignavibacteriales bacterium]